MDAVPLRSYILFFDKFATVVKLDKPTTVVPPELTPPIVLPEAISVAPLDEPKSNAVIEFPVVTPVMILLLTVDPAPLLLTDIGIIVPASVVMFEIVFPLIVLVGAPASVLRMPLNAEAPVSVKFEKLLLLMD